VIWKTERYDLDIDIYGVSDEEQLRFKKGERDTLDTTRLGGARERKNTRFLFAHRMRKSSRELFALTYFERSNLGQV